MLAYFIGLFGLFPFSQNFRKTIGLGFETMPKLVIVVIRKLFLYLVSIEKIKIVFAQKLSVQRCLYF